jgi:hypothetical protein
VLEVIVVNGMGQKGTSVKTFINKLKEPYSVPCSAEEGE